MKKHIFFSLVVVCGHLLQVPLCAMEGLEVKQIAAEDWDEQWSSESCSEDEGEDTPIELRVSVFDKVVDKLVDELQKPSEFQLFLDDYKEFVKKYNKVEIMVKHAAVRQIIDQNKIRVEVYSRIPLAQSSWYASRCKRSWRKLLQLKTRDSLAELGINWEINKKRIFDCDLNKKIVSWWNRPDVPEWLGDNEKFCDPSWWDEVSFTKHGDIVQWFTAKTKEGLPTNERFAYVTPFETVKEVYDFFDDLTATKAMLLLYFADEKLLDSEWYKKKSQKVVPESVKICLRNYYANKAKQAT